MGVGKTVATRGDVLGAMMRLLDLYCCAGGAAMGYHRAGFDEIVGVDIAPQKHYPFTFVLGDAIEYCRLHGREFDAIHASPPCQRYTQAQRIQGREHPDLLAPTRDAMNATGKPWFIENVPGAPMLPMLILCGSMFGLTWQGLTLYRHRWFESGGGFALPPFPPATCKHNTPSISIFGRCVLGGALNGKSYKHPNERQHLGVAVGRIVMGIPWMTRNELSEAIPPAYTEYIGRQLLASI